MNKSQFVNNPQIQKYKETRNHNSKEKEEKEQEQEQEQEQDDKIIRQELEEYKELNIVDKQKRFFGMFSEEKNKTHEKYEPNKK